MTTSQVDFFHHHKTNTLIHHATRDNEYMNKKNI